MDDLASDSADVFELVAKIPPEDRNNHILYVYRLQPEKVKGFIGKLTLPFDEETIQSLYGGGEYRLMLKRGSEVRKKTQMQIVGEPKTDAPAVSTSPTPGMGSFKSELVQALELIIKQNPQHLQAEVMAKTFTDAIALNKEATSAAIMKPSELVAMMREMNSMNGPKVEPQVPAWIAQLGTALIPVAVGLLQNMLTPKNPITEMTNIAQGMTQMKSLLGDAPAAAKPDYAAEFIRNGPGLLGKVAEIMAEARRATEIRLSAEQARQPAGPTIVQANPSLHTPPPPEVIMPAPRAVAGAGQIEQGAPTPEWVKDRATRMIATGQSPVFVLDYIEEQGVSIEVPPEWVLKAVAEMVEKEETAETVMEVIRKWIPAEVIAMWRQLPMDALREQIRATPDLGKVILLPHFDQWFKDFHAQLQAGAVPVQ